MSASICGMIWEISMKNNVQKGKWANMQTKTLQTQNTISLFSFTILEVKNKYEIQFSEICTFANCLIFKFVYPFNAAAPLTISLSSVVIAACLARL